MPLKFWKKEKGEEKGKDREGREPKEPEEKGRKEAKPEPRPEPRPEPAREVQAPAPAPAAKAAPTQDAGDAVDRVHGGLVELGLTVPATKGVWTKRVDAFPGGREAFLQLHRAEPYKAATKALVGWLAIRAKAEFDPEKLLADVNPRLSSFGLAVEVSGLAWLDQELGLRKCRMRLGEQEKIVRFKDARDFLKGVNDLLSSKKIAFVELETWSDDLAFLLVRDPKWAALAATEVVVVKDAQTATGGECGECGAKVGRYWNDCLSCGALFA